MMFFRKDGYRVVENPNRRVLKQTYSDTWKDSNFPEKQWGRAERQLKDIAAVPEFQAIINSVKATKLKTPSVLEVGCSSGYLSEVLKRAGIKSHYQGTDYSPSFIRFAAQKYPTIKFSVNDATNLHYKNNSFDVVVSGCCLLHIVDYEKAIAESARVARKYVIFHRTPVLHLTATTFLTKTAYGREMVEIFFNEEELVSLFRKYNLAVVAVQTISRGKISCLAEEMTIKNYVCRKIK